MKVKFWGVRGSAAAPDADKLGYGGNTSSIVISTDSMPRTYVLLDAGTGLTRFGNTLNLSESYDAIMLLSHVHLYHIIGFLFTPLAYSKNCRTRIVGPGTRNFAMESVFDHIMSPSYSPVYGRSYLLADVQFQEVSLVPLYFGHFTIYAAPFPHSEETESWGYRVEDGRSCTTYITNASLRDRDGRLYDNALALANGADLLILGTFDPSHDQGQPSTYDDGIELARAAGVENIIFCHHHPTATDEELDLERETIQDLNPDLNISLAIEDVVLEF
jgi:ribonuclease BN (tRNA processing enzyme)